MRHSRTLLAFLVLGSSLLPRVATAQEDPAVLIVTGKGSDLEVKKTAADAYRIIKDKGWPVHLQVGLLDHWRRVWSITDEPGEMSVIGTKADIGARLLQTSRTPDTDATILFLIDHGGQPDDRNTPLSATITVLGENKHREQELIAQYNDVFRQVQDAVYRAKRHPDDEEAAAELKRLQTELDRLDGEVDEARRRIPEDSLSHAELREFIAQLPADRPLIIVGGYCYDGALHSIAWERDNVVTASGTGFRNTYNFEPGKPIPFGAGFWAEVQRASGDKQHDIDGDGRTSLFEGYLAGMASDSRNRGLSSVSSMAYVDRYFHLDSYARSPYVEFTNSSELARLRTSEPFLVGRIQTDNILLPDCTFRPGSTGESCVRDILKFYDDIDRFLDGTDPADFRLDEKQLPDALVGLYRNIVDEWKKSSGDYRKRLEGFRGEYDRLRDEWNELDDAERRRRNREFVEAFDGLEERAQRELLGMYYRYRLIRQMERVALFMNTAPRAERDEFLQLLAREMRPL